MANTYTYRQKLLSKGFDLQKKAENCFVDAYNKGYSVVEIATICSMKTARYPHLALVKNKLIPAGKPGRQPKRIDLPDGLAKELRKCGLTFAQWCAGRRFTPDEAAAGLADRRSKVWDMVKSDFPWFYRDATGINVANYAEKQEKEDFEVVLKLSWSGLKKCYVAEIEDMGVEAVGKTPQEAVYHAFAQRKLLHEINILENLPPKRKNKK